MQKIRVLIIDEHPAVCQALAARLRSAPTIEVVGALSALPEGMESLDETRADVVLLDLLDRNGGSLEALATVLRLLTGRQASVIVLTSYMDEIERVRVMQAGARRYLLKDIDTLRLIMEIEAVAREGAPPLPLIPPGDRTAGKARLH